MELPQSYKDKDIPICIPFCLGHQETKYSVFHFLPTLLVFYF